MSDLAAAVSSTSWPVTLLFAVTLGHLLLVVFWVSRATRVRRDPDELVFFGAVVGLGTLMCVLNALAFTVGLSLMRGLVGLVLLHVVAAAVLFARRRRGPLLADARTSENRPFMPGDVPTPLPLIAIIGGVVVAALTIQWVIAASGSMRISGADAAHYHVPNAVNFALGANPFGLPATPHLYPMGTSVLAAWFILPFDDPLLIDLTILFPFLLAWGAILKLFREASGESGVTWGPWCVLLLFTMPLFQHALLMSADLFYTAAFLALNASLLSACVRFRLDAMDLLALALAAGMLLGTKATALVSTVSLFAVYGCLIVIERLVRGRKLLRPGVGLRHVSMAVGLLVASGGVWVIRSWWSFGSPLAPAGVSLFGHRLFEGATYQSTMYYVSVLADLQATSYNLAGHLIYWLRQWLGGWFLLSGLLVLVLVWDVVKVRRKSGQLSEAAQAKLILLVASVVLGAAHTLLLAGAPWSSLEWSRGSSLRYLLPFFALYGLLAYISCFPESTRWSRRFGSRAGVVVVLAVVVAYVAQQGVPRIPLEESVGRLTPFAVTLALALLAVTVMVRHVKRPWMVTAAAVAVAMTLAAAAAIYASRNDRALMRAAHAAFDDTAIRSASQNSKVGASLGTYLNLLAYERSAGISCSARRLFTTSRWDAPLDLQSPDYENQVFDVRGPTFRPWVIRRHRPGGEPCDYIVASKAELDTLRGVPLLNALKTTQPLRAVAEYGPYVVYAAR